MLMYKQKSLVETLFQIVIEIHIGFQQLQNKTFNLLSDTRSVEGMSFMNKYMKYLFTEYMKKSDI